MPEVGRSYQRTVPRKGLLWMIGLGMPVAGLAATIQLWEIAYLYNGIALGLAWWLSRRLPKPDQILVSRTHDAVLSARVPNLVTLKVTNDSDQTIRGTVRDEPGDDTLAEPAQATFELGPGQTGTFPYRVTPLRRGVADFPGTYLRLQTAGDFVARDLAIEEPRPVRVYPNVLALRNFDMLQQQGRLRELGIRRTRLKGQGTEFQSLREYADGDDYRRLDHKASARRGRLIVREYETERNQNVILVIDCGRHLMNEVDRVQKIDHVLDGILMISHAALGAGDQVGLLAYADDVVRFVPPRKGRNAANSIIDAAHDLQATPVESDPVRAFGYLTSRIKRRSLVLSFTDYDDPDRARDLAGAYGNVARRHVAALVRVNDPATRGLATVVPETVPQMYDVAAARYLQSTRKAAHDVVQSSGIHTLEADPEHLPAALVSFYFRVKERGLL